MITPNTVRKMFRFFSPRFLPARGAGFRLGASAGEPIVLGMRQTLWLSEPDSIALECVRGSLWVTRSDDPADVVLDAGERLTLSGARDALLQSFDATTVVRVHASTGP